MTKKLSDFLGKTDSVVKDENGSIKYLGAVVTDESKIVDVKHKEATEDSKEEWIFTIDRKTTTDGKDAYLEDILDRIPYGLFDKGITGIGATTLEIKAKRNSIIVVPTKALAYSKSNKYSNSKKKDIQTQYVGSTIKDKVERPTDEDLLTYIKNKKIPYKKFIVVADSLPRVLKAVGENVYQDYFLMVDEVDIIQSDANFRERLEDVIDYYFKFNPTNRSLVTATFRSSSHPLLEKEIKTTLKYVDESIKKREVAFYKTDNPNVLAKQTIEKHLQKNDHKILVAYNSIKNILTIIQLLKEEDRVKCGVLCSEASKDKVGEYYTELIDGKLGKQVTFMTCAYFVGIDIEEDIHLISISNIDIKHTLLSAHKLMQIAGRCRNENGIKSDTIIYSTSLGEWIDAHSNSKEYEKVLVEDAKDVLTLYEHIDIVEKRNYRLRYLLSNIRQAIERVAGLVREDVNENYQVSYFKIDSLVEERELELDVYYCKENVVGLLDNGIHSIIAQEEVTIDKTDEQQLAEKIVKLTMEKREISSIEELFKEIKESYLYINEKQNPSTAFYELKLQWQGQSYILNYLEKLVPYYKVEDLVGIKDLLTNDRRVHRRIYNSLIYKALPEDHSFKATMLAKFKKYIEKEKPIDKKEVLKTLESVLDLLGYNKPIKGHPLLKPLNSGYMPYLRIFFECKTRRGEKGTITIVHHYPKNILPIRPKKEIDSNADVGKLFDLL